MGGPCLRDPGSDSDGDTAVFLRHCVLLRVRDHSEMVHAREFHLAVGKCQRLHKLSDPSGHLPRTSPDRDDVPHAAIVDPGRIDPELCVYRKVPRSFQSRHHAPAHPEKCDDPGRYISCGQRRGDHDGNHHNRAGIYDPGDGKAPGQFDREQGFSCCAGDHCDPCCMDRDRQLFGGYAESLDGSEAETVRGPTL